MTAVEVERLDEGPATPAPPIDETVPIPWSVWRLALVIVFGAFMSGIDASVVNVGLETIARELDASLSVAQWAANGYLIALGVSLPACGWLGRRVGVGRLWLAALAGFTVTSGLCALAPDIGWLIAMRVLQGISAGLLIPAGQTILGQAVGPGRLGRVMAMLGMAVAVAPAIGPVVGGVVIHTGSWPWLFLVNLPLGAAGLVLGRRYVPRGDRQDTGRLDVVGLLLVTTGLPLVVYGATAWGDRGVLATPPVLVPLVAGLVALALFVWHVRTHPRPVLDLRLFARPAYAAACATTACTGAALFGAALILPLYFQIGRGQSVIDTGLSLISLGIGTAILLPLTGRLVDRYGGGIVCVAGSLATAAATVPFALLDTGADPVLLQGLLVLRGGAIALAAMPATTAAYKSVTRDQLPDATTQVNILMRLGGALGGSIFAVVLAAQLPDGVDAAFQTSFRYLTAASVLGAVAAVWLTLAERRTDPSTGPNGPAPTVEG
jgi:EmrB/QacA subfamily drug resistance transporter